MEKQLSAGLLQAQDMGYTPMMSVTCPPGFAPGAAFVVQDPSTGQQMQVVVPDGIAPGQTFQVQVPFSPPAPVPMAQQQYAQQYAPQPVAPQQVNVNMSMQAPPPQVINIQRVSQPQVVIMQNVQSMDSFGDRSSPQKGCTRVTNPGRIGISSWEVRDGTVCDQICLATVCSKWDKERSYIYIRDNRSIEVNDTNALTNLCTCCCKVQDNVRVEYFDRPPYARECNCAPVPWCCCIYFDQPKLEVIDLGCMCCCVKIDPCMCGRRVVLMPFENFPPPCCCCSNRVGPCDNCCGLYGRVTGNPKIFGRFAPQPKNAEAFVFAFKQALFSGGGAAISEEMER